MENLAAADRARVSRRKENALPPKEATAEPPRLALVETYYVPPLPPPDANLRMRTAQQSTADFVQRTNRSVARHLQQQQPTGPMTRNGGRMRSASSSSQASYASQTSQASRATQFSTTTTISEAASALPPSRLLNSNGPGAHHPFLWQRPAMIKTVRRARRAPGALFAVLPGEVLERILDHLRQLHLAEGSDSCATCWMRDAAAMAVTARKMLKYARAALYEHVELVGADAARQRKAMKPLQRGTRLVLLRRTLRASPALAAIVRTLKVPCFDAGGAIAATDAAYQDLVASVVMACPNLERVVGFYPPYDHTKPSRFLDALTRRVRLREINWIVEPSPAQAQQQQRQQRQQRQQQRNGANGHVRNRSRSRSFSQIIWPQTPPASPGCDKEGGASFFTTFPPSPPSPSSASFPPPPPPLDAQQCLGFLAHHTHWPYLTTMTVHCQPGATLAPSTLLVDTLARLPALRNLHLAHLPADAFDDTALLALPPLRKLTLVHLRGVTSDGLSAYASWQAAAPRRQGRPRQLLAALTLVHMRVDALAALARILSKLTALRAFALVQPLPPALAPGEAIWLFPYLASLSLRTLHWDVPTRVDRANTADVVVARSIAAGGFPQLCRLRAPADPDGLFQALCRPRERIVLPGDDHPEDRDSPAGRGRDRRSSAGEGGRRPKHRRSASASVSSASLSSFLASSLGHARTDSATSSSSSPSASPPQPPPPGTLLPQLHSDLRQARVAAQARLEAARRAPRFLVRVVDEDGRLTDEFALGGFLGTIQSPIAYDLLPDPGASDARGGLVDLETFLDPAGEELGGGGGGGGGGGVGGKDGEAARTEGCTGRWNADWDVPQKKDRDRWWHTERGRWHGAKLI